MIEMTKKVEESANVTKETLAKLDFLLLNNAERESK